MSRIESLAEYLRAEGRRKLDRVEVRDGGRNARSALALLDAAIHARSLGDDDPLIAVLVGAGCFGPSGREELRPDERVTRIVRSWESGDPQELLTRIGLALQEAPV
ncbi:hypothetical protein [Streptosporangium sandarakinum]|uniref:Uncharacterized protein n=1 Tax=Streptosporangium sandarakinum TaxID=1260955 RepID=A0A852V5A1_9ACTN|nr:hypothetical protein [Streptosporangium sandarakinum]NYF43260.1 hypothetical protein [Streptosporangium sandarakinum]